MAESATRPGIYSASNNYFGAGSGVDYYGSMETSGSRWIPQIFAKKTL